MIYKTLRIIQNRHHRRLMKKPNVVGTAVGKKYIRNNRTVTDSIVVLVERKMPAYSFNAQQLIDTSLDGYPVDVVEIGYIRALSLKPPTNRFRPLISGISIGHHMVTAGTLGAFVIDNKTNKPMILSNNHVIANSNDAKYGDGILQPGLIDDGTFRDAVAKLERWIPIWYDGEPKPDINNPNLPESKWANNVKNVANAFLTFGGIDDRELVFERLDSNTVKARQNACNYVDAAIALPIGENKAYNPVGRHTGAIDGITDASIGQKVCKAGRTTDYTEGYVDLLGATISVDYGYGRMATFVNQIIVRPETGYDKFSAGGDSGSLIVERGTQKAVGLLYAGSEVATIANPINTVMESLDIRF